ncbi:MAG: hypothetical protein ACR2PG_00035, partial [Hyphomicrobiaceae bacterium]
TSTELLSRAMAWMASDDKAANQAFNVANGDLIRWCRFWPKLADVYRIPVGTVRSVSLVDVMSDKEPVWQRVTERYGLERRQLSAVAHWAFADGTLERTWDEIQSTTKARAFGFHDFADSEGTFLAILDRYRSAKLLP